MAPSSDADDPNDVASSDPLAEDTTAIKKLSLNSSTGTLTSPSSSSASTLKPQSSYSIITLTLPSSSRDSLPFDLIVEILSRLPVKSLMQFQCVCKSWKSLISDPKFTKKHLRMSTKHHHLISDFILETFVNFELKLELIYMDCPITSVFTEVVSATAIQLEYPLTKQFSRCVDSIVGSCHDILCIALDDVSVVLWNPSIRKFNKLPSLEKSLDEFFFGYDHSSDTYKVVTCGSINNGNGVLINVVNVHTLGTNSWRTTQDFPSSGFLCEELSGKFVCGTITWLAEKIPTSSSNIISLDLEKESYLEIVPPDYGPVTLTSLKLGELRDCLCIFSRTGTFTDIWFMKEYGNKESWIKLFLED